MPLVWSSELATGNRPIDEQHRRLFQLFNDLDWAVGRDDGEREVSRTITALSVYVVAHFQMEEDLMRQGGYPGLAAHQVAHQLMKIQVEDMVDQYDSMRRDPLRVMRVLEQWLVEHVQKEDRSMAKWLRVFQDGSRS